MKKSGKYDISEILARGKLKKTKSRIAILEILSQAKKPLSQEQIASRLGSKGPNKVTIYRILEQFLEEDIVHRAYTGGRTWFYELSHNCTDTQCHPHFTCTNCGDIHCLTSMNIQMAKNPYMGFKITHQQVRLEGLCPQCTDN